MQFLNRCEIPTTLILSKRRRATIAHSVASECLQIATISSVKTKRKNGEHSAGNWKCSMTKGISRCNYIHVQLDRTFVRLPLARSTTFDVIQIMQRLEQPVASRKSFNKTRSCEWTYVKTYAEFYFATPFTSSKRSIA